MNIVQDARGGLSDHSGSHDQEVRTLSAEEATCAGSGGAASDTAHYAASPRPPGHTTLLRLSL